jgi:hypothetical protein
MFVSMRQKRVKCTLVQALRLCTGRTAHRGSSGIALPFLDHGTRRVWGVSLTPWPLFTPGKGPVPIVQEAGWAPGPVWTGAQNLAPTGIRSPGRPARSQSLYRLRYPAHLSTWNQSILITFFCMMHMLNADCAWSVVVQFRGNEWAQFVFCLVTKLGFMSVEACTFTIMGTDLQKIPR